MPFISGFLEKVLLVKRDGQLNVCVAEKSINQKSKNVLLLQQILNIVASEKRTLKKSCITYSHLF